MECDICGKPAVGRALVEGAAVNVCTHCARLGTMLSTPTASLPRASSPAPGLPEYELVEGYGSIIRLARIRKGMETRELGRKLNIAENLIKQLESETHTCDVGIARKLEIELGITLVQLVESVSTQAGKGAARSGEPTLGDIALMKKPRGAAP